MYLSEKLKLKLANVKMLISDVDGTLTDSAMYYNENGEELKRFSTRDGMAFKLLKKAEIMTCIMTSENSPIAKARAEKLQVDELILGSHDKSNDAKIIAKKFALSMDEIAFVGDDVNDQHVMNEVGVSACPEDAVPIIRQIATYVCSKKGGYGAVREFAEMILLSQNKPISLTENW